MGTSVVKEMQSEMAPRCRFTPTGLSNRNSDVASGGEDVGAAAGGLGRSGTSVATASKVQVCSVPEQVSLETFFTPMSAAVSAAAEPGDALHSDVRSSVCSGRAWRRSSL